MGRKQSPTLRMHCHWPFSYKKHRQLFEKSSRQNKCIRIDLYLFNLFFPPNYNNIEVKSGQVSQFEEENEDGKAEEQCYSHNVTLASLRPLCPPGPAASAPLPACQIVIYIPLLFLFCW